MAKERTFYVSRINVVIHPHSIVRYVDLWRTAFRSRRAVEIGASFKGLIGSAHPVERGNFAAGIQGEFYKYFDLDPTGDWFNLESAKVAEPEDLVELNIPAKLKPDLTLFNYFFVPKTHRLIYESKTANGKSLGPLRMEKLLRQVFVAPTVQERFGTVEVTAIPRKNSLDVLYSIPRLSTVTIDIRKPNADDDFATEQQIMARLDAMKARREEVKFVAERDQSLELDAEAKALAEVAKSNGKVVAEGYDGTGARVVKSTVSMPLIEPVRYDPNLTDAKTALMEDAIGIQPAAN